MVYSYYLLLNYEVEVKRLNFETLFIAFINNFNLTIINSWMGPGSTIPIDALQGCNYYM